MLLMRMKDLACEYVMNISRIYIYIYRYSYILKLYDYIYIKFLEIFIY